MGLGAEQRRKRGKSLKIVFQIGYYTSHDGGCYQGLASDNHFAHPFWNDTRTGSQQVFTAAVPSAQP
ncbi:MAG TPA: hypothetical protein VKV40_19290 [Ktedonobacteraceae bacterium]|nr:hypothetical protein [Ktedonobacteraceae bacterium]